MKSSPHLELGRHPERSVADMAAIRELLLTQTICHVAFVVDGWPYAVPTVHALDGERLLIHGSSLSRMLGSLSEGVPVCVTVTAVDGIVCARSAFNHSINYRSAMVFGTAVPVREEAEKVAALRAIVEHVLPGRWSEVRGPKPSELKATEVVALPLDAVTAKMRSGGPGDAPADRGREVWAGVLPVETRLGSPVLVPDEVAGLPLPESILAAVGASHR